MNQSKNSSKHKNTAQFLFARRKKIHIVDLLLWLGMTFVVFFLESVPFSSSFSESLIVYGLTYAVVIFFALAWWGRVSVIFWGTSTAIFASLLGFYTWLELITHGTFWDHPEVWLFGEHSSARVYVIRRAPVFASSMSALLVIAVLIWVWWLFVAKRKLRVDTKL